MSCPHSRCNCSKYVCATTTRTSPVSGGTRTLLTTTKKNIETTNKITTTTTTNMLDHSKSFSSTSNPTSSVEDFITINTNSQTFDKNSVNNEPSSASFIDEYWWIFIVVGVVCLFLIVAVIVFVLKKNNNNSSSTTTHSPIDEHPTRMHECKIYYLKYFVLFFYFIFFKKKMQYYCNINFRWSCTCRTSWRYYLFIVILYFFKTKIKWNKTIESNSTIALESTYEPVPVSINNDLATDEYSAFPVSPETFQESWIKKTIKMHIITTMFEYNFILLITILFCNFKFVLSGYVVVSSDIEFNLDSTFATFQKQFVGSSSCAYYLSYDTDTYQNAAKGFSGSCRLIE